MCLWRGEVMRLEWEKEVIDGMVVNFPVIPKLSDYDKSSPYFYSGMPVYEEYENAQRWIILCDW